MKKKILLVEDELGLHRIASISLEGFGYEVVALTTGEEALDWLERNTPDLILLDSVLPNIQGEEVCKQLKSNDKLKPGCYLAKRPGLPHREPRQQSVGHQFSAKKCCS